LLGIGLALAAAISWGAADFLGGLQAKRLSTITVVLGVEVVGLVISAVVLAIATPEVPSAGDLAAGAAAGLSGVVGLGCFYRALAIGTMSVVAPISSTGVIVPVVVGLASGDRPAAAQGLGLAFALVGVLLAGREAEEGVARGKAAPGVLLALVAALGFGGYFVGADAAADGGVIWALFMTRLAATPVLAALALGRGVALWPGAERGRVLVLIGTLDLAATGLYALASTEGLLTVVSVLAALYPVTTVLLARALLGERLQRVQSVGVVAALVGVGLIAAG
jgi:drug/metabolite transporter (DMT)-like permease